jgi:transcriptional regulator with XRE-family HTH domain
MGSQELKLFAKRLHELRVKKGVSQEELAERAGIHRNYVGRLERAEQNPSLDRICDLARALGVKPAELFERNR